MFGIGLDQLDLCIVAPGELQVFDGLTVDEEHRGRGTVFRGHVGNGGAITQREGGRTRATELQIGTNHFFLAQELGHGQHNVRGRDACGRLATELHAHDVGQAHPGGATQHDVFGFQAAHADGDDAQRIHMRGVTVGADAGIGEGHTVAHLNDRRHFLQVDLVHDPVARGNDIDVLEGRLGPVDEMKAVFVAPVFDGAVLGEGIRIETAALHGKRVVDDQLHRHYGVDLCRVAALVCNGVAQACEIHECGLAEDVMADHTGRKPREIEIPFAIDQLCERGRERGRVAASNEIFGEHARGIGQRVIRTGSNGFHGRAGVEVVQLRAGQRGAIGGIRHGRDFIRSSARRSLRKIRSASDGCALA